MVGTLIALASAMSFAVSGSFAKGLLDAGWSPGAAVTVRIVGAALVLAPALLLVPGDLRRLPRAAWPVIGYGALGVAGAQLCYFMALDTLPVSVALLIEYSAPVLIVGWTWARSGRRPNGWVLIGTVVAVTGLVAVIDPAGATLDPVGLAWASGAGLCNAGYFLLSARAVDGIAPLTMTAAGVGVAGLGIGATAALGLLPVTMTFGSVTLAGAAVPWWLPAVGLVLVSTVLAYGTGLLAARRLGAQLASFVALTEVVFAVLAAWVLAGEVPGLPQLVGGVVMLAGVATVRAGSVTDQAASTTSTANGGRYSSTVGSVEPEPAVAGATREGVGLR